MARELKPCGTPAAYRRHLRKGEPACAECLAAVAAQKMASLDGDREVRKLSVLAAVTDLPPSDDLPDAGDDFDPLADAKENLRLVKAALDNAVPREVATLSKRRQELVALIADLGGKKEVSLADQLAEIRRRRAGA